MSNRQRSILSALRESVGPHIEPTVGTDAPVKINSCSNCAGFVLELESGLPEMCPICGANPFIPIHYGDITQGQVDRERVASVQMMPNSSPEAEEVLEEAIELLNKGLLEKYASSYRKITSINHKGELVAITESGVARRRLNAKQRSNYRLSENARKLESVNGDRLTAIRINAFMINEARGIKRRALRTALREGMDPNKDNIDEIINDEIDNSEYTEYIEDILKDTEVAEMLAEGDSKGAVVTTISDILTDAGLEVINAEVVDSDDEYTVISVKVGDNPNTELHVDDIVESLEDLVDGEVTVNGVADGTGDVVDLEFVIGTTPVIENADEDDFEFELIENDEDLDEYEEEELTESVTVSKRRRRFLESITVGDQPGEVVITAESAITPEDITSIYAELVTMDIPAGLASGVLTIPYEEEGSDGVTLSTIKGIVDPIIGEGKFELLGEKVELDENDEDLEEDSVTGEDPTGQFAIVSTDEPSEGMLLATDGSLVDPNQDDAEDFARVFTTRAVADDVIADLNDPNYKVVEIEVVPVEKAINEFIQRVNKLSTRGRRY